MFKPASALVGGSLDEMKQKYEARRDKEFAAHVCVKHLREVRCQRSLGRCRYKPRKCETKNGSKHLKTAEK